MLTPARIPEAKLNPPVFMATQVLRGAIRDQVSGSAVKLVLVRAPAGFGKTTAMAQIREHLDAQGLATAWLTLDRADNDVSRFLGGLAEAVQRLGIEAPAGPAPFDAVAALAACDSPFALFLDDFEVVQEPAVLGLVRELVDYLPRGGQIVLGSRSLPDLGLGRFLQADPVIQSPANAQSWNAYSYVFNNPYKYTDPTGLWGQQERQWTAIAVAIVAACLGQPYMAAGKWFQDQGACSAGCAYTLGTTWGPEQCS